MWGDILIILLPAFGRVRVDEAVIAGSVHKETNIRCIVDARLIIVNFIVE